MSGRLYLENRRPPVFIRSAVVDSDGDEVWYREHIESDLGDKQVFMPETTTAVVLGPGTSITSKAVRSIVDGGCSVCWTSRGGLRLRTTCDASTVSSTLLAKRQYTTMRSDLTRRQAYRRALTLRFGETPPENYSVNSLRGWEGTNMRKFYKRESDVRGIYWEERRNEGATDYLNSVISCMNAVVYTACEIATRSLLMSTHIGYSHEGPDAWVYDIADCFKNNESIIRTFDWFHGRDRQSDLESPYEVALASWDNIAHAVFSRFYNVIDEVLIPESALK